MSFAKTFTVAAVLTSIVAGSAAPVLAGRIPGPGSLETRVEAHDSDSYSEVFRGGEWARVVVEGDGDTDLDLYVYDEYGNLLAKDDDRLDYCVVRFRPGRTGEYRIVVKNLGSVWNQYTIEMD